MRYVFLILWIDDKLLIMVALDSIILPYMDRSFVCCILFQIRVFGTVHLLTEFLLEKVWVESCLILATVSLLSRRVVVGLRNRTSDP